MPDAAPEPVVRFDTHPDRYRHWTLTFDGPVATLALAVGGLRGRFHEERRDDDHRLDSLHRTVPDMTEDGIGEREVTQLSALSERLREDDTVDCQKGLDRWNRALDEAGSDVRLRLPHIGFHRQVWTFAGHHVSPAGSLPTGDEWYAGVDGWLPTDDDRAHVESLMVGVTEPGKMAGWIAAPASGINQKPVDYEYVRL